MLTPLLPSSTAPSYFKYKPKWELGLRNKKYNFPVSTTNGYLSLKREISCTINYVYTWYAEEAVPNTKPEGKSPLLKASLVATKPIRR